MKALAKKESVRTTIYLNKSIKSQMDHMVKKHLITSQTDFINQALQSKISEMEKEINIKNLIKKIDAIKPIKSKKSSVQMIREIRRERINRLIKLTHQK